MHCEHECSSYQQNRRKYEEDFHRKHWTMLRSFILFYYYYFSTFPRKLSGTLGVYVLTK